MIILRIINLPVFFPDALESEFTWHAACSVCVHSVINTETGCGDGYTELLIVVEEGRFCLASAVLTKEEL